ncbi:Type II CAAX prenyl endopeptidase Rce1-like [Popillia japonica]|uniref:CAAX prenyl protease 2 n=1 Tax=Popillia japonica TaxID=7064 RepID=A0AAW1LAW9_POPJA
MEYKFIAIPDCLLSIGTCFVLSAIFISSLYVWNSHHDRDHSSTIKKRFLSVFIVMLISPAFVYFAINKETLEKRTLWHILGLRTDGLLQALLLPLFLTMVLFTGPIYMQRYNGSLKMYADPSYWTTNIRNLIWLRNHIVAPLAEEFTYRSCMLPILLQCFSPMTAVFVCPLFFGAGHFHHVIEKMKKGMKFKHAMMVSCFHCFYTTIFGIYSAYLLLRTGHFASAFIVHAFCNHMGFPEFHELVNYEKKQKILACTVFVVGFVLWCLFLNPLTEPTLFHHDLHL